MRFLGVNVFLINPTPHIIGTFSQIQTLCILALKSRKLYDFKLNKQLRNNQEVEKLHKLFEEKNEWIIN